MLMFHTSFSFIEFNVSNLKKVSVTDLIRRHNLDLLEMFDVVTWKILKLKSTYFLCMNILDGMHPGSTLINKNFGQNLNCPKFLTGLLFYFNITLSH